MKINKPYLLLIFIFCFALVLGVFFPKYNDLGITGDITSFRDIYSDQSIKLDANAENIVIIPNLKKEYSYIYQFLEEKDMSYITEIYCYDRISRTWIFYDYDMKVRKGQLCDFKTHKDYFLIVPSYKYK